MESVRSRIFSFFLPRRKGDSNFKKEFPPRYLFSFVAALGDKSTQVKVLVSVQSPSATNNSRASSFRNLNCVCMYTFVCACNF